MHSPPPSSAPLQVRRLGVELLRTARELHRTLCTPPQPSGKRTTVQHAPDGGPPPSRLGLRSRGDAALPSRRATAAHGAAGGGGALAALAVQSTPDSGGPGTPGSASRVTYVADILDK